jgi:hypothetical protein
VKIRQNMRCLDGVVEGVKFNSQRETWGYQVEPFPQGYTTRIRARRPERDSLSRWVELERKRVAGLGVEQCMQV